MSNNAIHCQELSFEPRDDGGMRVYRAGVLDVVIPASVWQYIVMETRIPSSMTACTISASVAGSIGSIGSLVAINPEEYVDL